MAAYGSTNLTVETRSPPRDQQKRPSITTHSPGATTIVYDEEAAPPPSPTDQAEARVMRRSLEANVVLTVAKVAVAFQSGSLAVLASLIDSALDLISQIVLFAASARRKDRDVEYPAGRARLEPVGVVVCAMLMGVGSVYVIITSTEQLTDIVKGKNVHVALDRINGTIMVLAIVWKALLYAWISKRHSALSSSNPGVAAVALDHFNDVLSNLVAVIAAVLAAWYGLDAADPAGAIAISLYIAYSWLETSIEQVQHLVGRTADPEFLEELREAASTYSERMQCDIVRAYHFGPRYLVELEQRKEHCLCRPKNSQSKPPAAAQQPQPETIDARAPAPRHAMALPIQARRRRPPSRLALLFAVCKCSDALTLSRRPLRQTRRTQLKMMDEVECDVAIVGGGPAGCCCALYTARADHRTVILDKNPSVGALAITSHIANYPGVDKTMGGDELLDKMREQAVSYGTDYRRAQVFMVDVEGEQKVVYTPDVTVKAKTLVLATGALGHEPSFAGEAEFLGRGVSYCATCDAAFYRDAEVCVVGSGNEAIEEAEYLTKFASTVHWVTQFDPRWDEVPHAVELRDHPNVKHWSATRLMEVVGDDAGVNGVVLKRKGGEEVESLSVEGCFIYVAGSKPITDFLSENAVELQDDGGVAVNDEMETSVPGVFAIGDIRNTPFKQVVVAAADGCIAAMSIDRFLKGRKKVRVDWVHDL